MLDLQTFHGHLVDLRRHVNVYRRHLHPLRADRPLRTAAARAASGQPDDDRRRQRCA